MSNVSSSNGLEKRPKLRFPGFEGEWRESTIGDTGTFYYGHSCPKWSVTPESTTPCIRYGELYTKFGTIIDRVYSYTNVPKEKLRFSNGSEVLVPRVGEDPADYNHCAWLSIPNIAIGEMISVYNTKQNPLFMAIMFNATLKYEFAKRVEGNSVTNLYYEKLKDIIIHFPDIDEQQKIVSFLTLLDERIAKQRELVEILKKYKRGALSKLFPQKDEIAPQCRFAGFTEPWKQCKLGEIADIVGGGTPSTSNPNYWDGEIDWYTPAEIADQIYVNSSAKKITEKGFENSSTKMLPIGTILFTSRAGIGKTAILRKEGCTNQGFQSIVPHENELDSYFIFSRTEELKKYGEVKGAGSTFVEVSGKQMANMTLMIPKNYEEQQVISTYFSALDRLITIHLHKQDKLERIKLGLLQQLFI